MAQPYFNPRTGRWEFPSQGRPSGDAAPGAAPAPRRTPMRPMHPTTAHPAAPPWHDAARGNEPAPRHGAPDGPGDTTRAVRPARPAPTVTPPVAPAATPPAEPRSARRWPWITAVVAAFLVGLAIPMGGDGSGQTVVQGTGSAPAPAARETASASPFSLGRGEAPFTLEARSGSGNRVDVVWTSGTGGVNENTQRSGWTTVVDEGSDLGTGVLTVSTGGRAGTDTVTCRITDAAGEVIAEESGTGRSASATCTGY